jgi:hypothetical protein
MSMRMTPGRTAVLIVGVPIALALIGWTGYDFVALAGQGSVPVHVAIPVSHGGVSADSGGGDVVLRQAAIKTAELTGTGEYSLFQPTLKTTQTATGVSVRYDCQDLAGNCGLNATLEVPFGTGVTLSADGGDVSIPSFNGAVTVDTGGGDLGIGSFTGSLQAKADGGDISADTLDGQLSLQTGGGDLTVNSVISDSRFQAGADGGDVAVQALADPVATIDSGGGDVTLTFVQPPRNVQITADGGDIAVILPPGSTVYDISADADGGNVSIGSSVRVNSDSPDTLTLDSGGGDITVSEAS